MSARIECLTAGDEPDVDPVSSRVLGYAVVPGGATLEARHVHGPDDEGLLNVCDGLARIADRGCDLGGVRCHYWPVEVERDILRPVCVHDHAGAG